MKEDFLHYIWQHRKFKANNLLTVNSEPLTINTVGTHNQHTGPDFFNAHIKIGEQLWAGNVEVHIRSGDWFVHNHEKDTNYDNVILHVVWEYDVPVFRKDNTEIPTLELKDKVPQTILNNYQKLFNKNQLWINCEHDFAGLDEFRFNYWLERLFIERLEQKSIALESMLQKSNNDWEAVLFKLLVKNFGLKINADAFLSIANSLDFTIIRKISANQQQLEALLFGQAGLLQTDVQDAYITKLKKEYEYLKVKFKLNRQGILPVQFFRLRPSSFPTIRLSQLANLYHQQQHLFSVLITTNSLDNIHDILNVATSTYWETHYTFAKASKRSVKKLSKAFIRLVIINTLIPLKFSYSKHVGNDVNDALIALISQLPPEKNNIINKFNSFKKVANNALQSQALLQLKNVYCDKDKCLKCVIGNSLIEE